MVLSLAPRQELTREAFDADQVLIGIQGQGTITIATTATPITSNTALIIPTGVEHTIANTGSTPLGLYKIFAPPFLHPTK